MATCDVKPLIFIPCYNCATHLRELLEDLKNLPISFPILIVDNSSNDSCSRVYEDFASSFSLCNYIKNSKNIGLGGSHKKAFSFAKRQNITHLIALHGDNQCPADQIMMIDFYSDTCVVGSRFLDPKKYSSHSYKKWGNQFLAVVYSFIMGVRVTDIGCGLACYPLASIDFEKMSGYSNDGDFNYQLLIGNYFGKIHEIPIKWRLDGQESNVSSIKMAIMALYYAFKHYAR